MGRNAVHGRALQPRSTSEADREKDAIATAFRLIGAAAVVVTLSAATSRAHDPITTKVTWNGEVGRIVQARCVRCHAPDGRGPMPLTTWEQARPWAKAMKEEVLTRRMPKWHAARGYGDFSNDPSLSPFDIALIVSWADGGAPLGERLRPERPFDAAQGRPEALEGRGAKLPRESDPSARSGSSRAPSRGERGWGPASAEKREPDGRFNLRILPCGTQRLSGRLIAVRPQLRTGASAEITAQLPDGRREIIGWIRNFDPEFMETYWLRTPLHLPPGSRLNTVAEGACSIAVTLAAREQEHGTDRR